MLNIPYFLCEGLYHNADLYACQQRFREAQSIIQEALDTATQVGRKDIQFQAHVLAIRLRAVLRQIGQQKAIEELEALRAEWRADVEQAAICYEIWRLDSRREANRRTAADRYHELYARTPNVEYGRRYADLTGERLPDPPPLPPLPNVATRSAASLDDLLARTERLIETAPWEQQNAE